MRVRREVLPFLAAALAIAAAGGFFYGLQAGAAKGLSAGMTAAGVLSFYLLYFFRDPERVPPAAADAVVAGADGVIAGIGELREEDYLKCDAVRISIFLSLFDVHVNRAPIGGKAKFLGYFPGKRFLTFNEKSSLFNQHNSILIEGATRCLIRQIVGPVCRRVVYWLDHEGVCDAVIGQRIGMMKFGSRLDMYLPGSDVEILVRKGQRVRAGETVVARIRSGN